MSASRSEAATKANRTRRIRSARTELGKLAAFDTPGKQSVRRAVLRSFLKVGGTVAELHGPTGDFARMCAKSGLTVISAEDGRYLVKKTGLPEEDVRDALSEMARDGGYELHWGNLAQVLGRADSVFYDACGPLYVDSPSASMIRSIADARVEAFAVTAMLSRIDGVGRGGERSVHYYKAIAEAVLKVDAPAYEITKTIEYRGAANTPFAVYLLRRKWCRTEPIAYEGHPSGYYTTSLGYCSAHAKGISDDERLALMRHHGFEAEVAQSRMLDGRRQHEERVEAAFRSMKRDLMGTRSFVQQYACHRATCPHVQKWGFIPAEIIERDLAETARLQSLLAPKRLAEAMRSARALSAHLDRSSRAQLNYQGRIPVFAAEVES